MLFFVKCIASYIIIIVLHGKWILSINYYSMHLPCRRAVPLEGNTRLLTEKQKQKQKKKQQKNNHVIKYYHYMTVYSTIVKFKILLLQLYWVKSLYYTRTMLCQMNTIVTVPKE